MRSRNAVDQNGKGSGKKLRGTEGEETEIMIHLWGKSIFNKRNIER